MGTALQGFSLLPLFFSFRVSRILQNLRQTFPKKLQKEMKIKRQQRKSLQCSDPQKILKEFQRRIRQICQKKKLQRIPFLKILNGKIPSGSHPKIAACVLPRVK